MPETFVQSPYTAEKFIDREEEGTNIISILRHPEPRIHAFVVEGDRGIGKTWLSLHLQRTKLKEIPGVTSWLFSLSDPGEGYRPWGDRAQPNEHFDRMGEQFDVHTVLRGITSSLSLEMDSQQSIAETVEAVRRYMQSHSDERFVLILDSAYESDWALLAKLEAYLLGNLLTLSNFFVIVTGRGRPYPWNIPALIEAVRFGLGHFTFEQIEEQLARFGLSSILSARDIYNIGNGWPIFTEVLARAANRTEALHVAADLLFAVTPVQERPQIRLYFEALSPMDGFGEAEAALMIRAYDPTTFEPDGRAICRKMNETRLISWKDGRYVMNPPVQKILRQYLPLKKTKEWIRLNCAAYHHFEQQYADPALNRFRSFFKNQMEIHARALSDSGVVDPESCATLKAEEAQ